ncbi:MAG TPA: PDZ domain-containing protein, partial [Planctomycetaceae bacterium]
RLLLQSNADFQGRIRLLSEDLGLHTALARLDANDVRIQAALAATQANWHASRQAWPEAVAAYDRLIAADPGTPHEWLRAPGLLRLATALLHQERPAGAAMLLAASAKRNSQDPAMIRIAGFGFNFSPEGGPARVRDVFPGSPAARGNLLPGDLFVKVNGIDTTNATVADVMKLIPGGVGTKAHLTLRHPGRTETVDVDLVKANNLFDAEAATLFSQLRTELEKRLAAAPRDAGLLELHAELAGQELDFARQVADYTAAIAILSEEITDAAPARHLARLYRRRGDAYVKWQKWPAALEDYARVVTQETTDEELLTDQALAQAEVLFPRKKWTVLKPAKMTSMAGSKLTELDDHSILAGGANPPGDQFTVEFIIPDRIEVRSIRLETMTHDSLPGRGPGRSTYAFNGVFALTGWELTAIGPTAIDTATNDSERRLNFSAAWADYSANGAPLGLDGLWNITFGPGQDHISVWNLPEPVMLAAGTVLRSHMRFNESAPWSDQNLGRFRLSVSSDPAAFGWERKRLAVSKLTDPWQKLAAAHRLRGDQPAIDQLVERHLKSAGLIGDLFTQGEAEEPDWSRAAAIYSRAITPETTDVDLLSKRARADEALKDWDAAASDWSRAAAENPDGAKLLAEFARRLAASDQAPLAKGQFQKSQALYERSLEADPDNDLLVAELAQLLLDNHKHENASRWTILQSVAAKSELGAMLTILSGDSILASGPDPLDDRYRVVLTVGADIDLRAVRLEALTHPSLPGNGPGRYPGRGPGNSYFKGTFGQTSWKVTATLPNRKDPILFDFDQASADHVYDQDIKPNGSWNIAGGGEGRDCTAIWSMKAPISLVAGSTLTFEMQLKSFQNVAENLGHFRLSVCGDSATVDRERQRLAATQILDPWLKLAAAYAVNGDTERAADLLAKSTTTNSTAAWTESGLLTDTVLESLQSRHLDSYTRIVLDA